jgi:hypothetical protein
MACGPFGTAGTLAGSGLCFCLLLWPLRRGTPRGYPLWAFLWANSQQPTASSHSLHLQIPGAVVEDAEIADGGILKTGEQATRLKALRHCVLAQALFARDGA